MAAKIWESVRWTLNGVSRKDVPDIMLRLASVGPCLSLVRPTASGVTLAHSTGGRQDHGASGVVFRIGPHSDPHAFDPERHRHPIPPQRWHRVE